MFKLLRYYSVASLVAVLATAALLTWLYRQVAIEGIARIAEQGNLRLAQMALEPIEPDLLEFLDRTGGFEPGNPGVALPPRLAGSVRALLQERFVVKIKIYNRQGVVVFSSKPADIGRDQRGNQGVIAASGGGVASELVYRDTFNRFDGITEKDNLMQTYLPVRSATGGPVQGVFELYADVNTLVRQTERIQFIVMAGALLILTALYGVLILVVQRASSALQAQQRCLHERARTLARLSADMLKTEEAHRKKVAFELHEGLAQTLAGIKLQAQSGLHACKAGDAAAGTVKSIIPVLQEAIEGVRTMATELRPASLDDLGLLPTLNWLCRELEQQYPGFGLKREISLQERDIPTSLKAILYRIIVSVLGDMAQHTKAGQVCLALWCDDKALFLLIDDTASEALDAASAPPARRKPQRRDGFVQMEVLTTLSGGSFCALHHAHGRTTLSAQWASRPFSMA